MKYIFTIIFSLALVSVASPAFASTTPWQGITTGQGTNTISTGTEGVVKSAPVASPAPSAGPFTSTQTVTLSAPGSTSIHYFFNTTDFSNALTCSTGATTNPVTISGSGLLRAIACYGGDTASSTLATFSYVFTAPPATTPAASTGGSSGGSSGGGSYTPPTTQPTVAHADFNGDGVVDILDFNTLIIHWGMTSGATKADGDANSDGKVDIFDFNILITHWTN